MAIEPTVIIASISSLAAIAGGYFSFRASSQANRTAARKVDLEAFERSQTIYEKTIDRLQGQTDRLGAQVDAVNSRLAQEMDVSNALRDQIRTLRGQVDDLNATVANLRAEVGRPAPRPSHP